MSHHYFVQYKHPLHFFSTVSKKKLKREMLTYASYFSAPIAIVLAMILPYIDNVIRSEILTDVLKIVALCLSGMLIFVMIGLSTLIQAAKKNVLLHASRSKQANKVINMCWSYYYSAAWLIAGFLLTIINILLVNSNLCFTTNTFYAYVIMTNYIISYSILYAISLIGTNINMFVVSAQRLEYEEIIEKEVDF